MISGDIVYLRPETAEEAVEAWRRHAGARYLAGGTDIAAAARRTAAPHLIVQLPELRMGLIPGAGGTATLGRAMGRHRLMWLVLGGFRIGSDKALDWGLIHAIDS